MSSVLDILSLQELIIRKEHLLKQIKKVEIRIKSFKKNDFKDIIDLKSETYSKVENTDNNYITKEVLQNNAIQIVAENVGGTIGRKLKYNTGTGQVMMKFLTKST